MIVVSCSFKIRRQRRTMDKSWDLGVRGDYKIREQRHYLLGLTNGI